MSNKGDGGGQKSQKIGDVIFGQLHIIIHYVVDYPMGLRLVKNHSGPFATPIKHTPFRLLFLKHSLEINGLRLTKLYEK